MNSVSTNDVVEGDEGPQDESRVRGGGADYGEVLTPLEQMLCIFSICVYACFLWVHWSFFKCVYVGRY